MKEEIDEYLKHYGIKGMRWGIRRNRNRPGGADGKEESTKVKDTRSNLRKNLDSLKRERQWRQVVSQMDKLSTKDINAVTRRISLENELKRHSRAKGVGTKKDKSDYLRRENMSDAELTRKVTRLRAKSALVKQVSDASKEQVELGEKVVGIAKGVGMKLAVRKVTGKPLKPDDFYGLLKDYKEVNKKTKSELQKEVLNKIKEQNNPG